VYHTSVRRGAHCCRYPLGKYSYFGFKVQMAETESILLLVETVLSIEAIIANQA
jgi:hypothetical protein